MYEGRVLRTRPTYAVVQGLVDAAGPADPPYVLTDTTRSLGDREKLTNLSDSLFERVARGRVAALHAPAEPLHALRGRSVGEFVGRDMASGHLLQTIVADGSSGVQRFVHITGIQFHAAVRGSAGLCRIVSPHARVAIGLQLHPHGPRVRIAIERFPIDHSGKVLDVVPDLVRNHIGLGEIARCLEAPLQLGEEAEVQIDAPVSRTIE